MYSETKRHPLAVVEPAWVHEIELIFFDLDGTLFDHFLAEKQALGELSQKRAWPVEEFYQIFKVENELAWKEAEKGNPDIQVLRRRRFSKTFDRLNISYTLEEVDAASDEYLGIYAGISAPLPGLEVVNLLAEKGYQLGMLTNGFTPTQLTKVKMLGLEGVFDPFVAGDSVGAMKPAPAIFRHAEELSGVASERIALIGDHPVADIGGGRAAGWRTIHIDPTRQIEAEADLSISHLNELTDIFPGISGH